MESVTSRMVGNNFCAVVKEATKLGFDGHPNPYNKEGGRQIKFMY